MGELDHREDWAPKNWCFQIGAGEDSWGSLGQQGDQTSQSLKKSTWMFTGRTDAEAEVPVLRPPYVKSQLIGKDPEAWKEQRQEKGTIEDEMVERHHWLNRYDFEETPGDSEG